MKKVLIIILAFVAFIKVNGQPISGFVPYSSQNQVRGLATDTFFYLPYRDTNFTPKRKGALVHRYADDRIYLAISTTSGTKKWLAILTTLERGRFGYSGEDISASAGRSFNTGGYDFQITGGPISADSIKFSATGEPSFTLRHRTLGLLSFPVATLTPTGTTSRQIAVDIIPRGTPGDFSGSPTNGVAWVDVCNTDVSNNTNAVDVSRIGITTTYAYIASIPYNGSTAKPLKIFINTSERASFNTDNTASFNIGKITQSQSISGDYVGYALINSNNSVANSNALIYFGQDFVANRIGYFRWNNNADASNGIRSPNGVEIAANSGASGGLSIGALGGATGNDIKFFTGNLTGTERARIDYAGNVGIATTSPAAKFHVAGTAALDSFTRFKNLVAAPSTPSSGYGYLYARADSMRYKNSAGIEFTLGIGGGGGGVTTLAAIGSSANANGATISGSTLNLEPASAFYGGVVTTDSQTFAGNKTFNGNLTTTGNLYLPTSFQLWSHGYQMLIENAFDMRFTNPGQIQHYHSGYLGTFKAWGPSGSAGTYLIGNDSYGDVYTDGGNNALALQGSNASGKVGVRTTTPGYTLDVNGTVNVPGTTGNTYRWNTASGTPSNTSTPAGWVKINVNGADAWLPYYQ